MRMLQTHRIKRNLHRLASLFALVTGVLGTGLAHAAGGASFSLSPASGSHNINATFSVNIYENSGNEAVNAVDAHVNYDQSKLQLISVSNSGSPFGLCGQQPSGGGGSATISCAKTGGGVTGNQLVGSITFKALVGSGSASVSFASNSHIIRESDTTDIWNGVTTGGTYSFTTPAASTPTSTTTTTTTKKTTSTTPTPATNTAQQQADPAAPVPTSTAAEPTYMVAVRVINQSGQTVEGASVKIGDQTVKSDASGIASFSKVKSGSHSVQVTSTQGSAKLKITVDPKTGPNTILQFEAKLKPKTNTLPYIFIPLVVLVVALGIWLQRKRSGLFPRAKTPKNPKITGISPTVVHPRVDTNLTIEALEEKVDSPHVAGRSRQK